MNAATKKFLMEMASKMPARKKSEFEFIKEAMPNDKKSRSGVMKLAWFYKKRDGISFGEAQKKAHNEISERIRKKQFVPKSLDYYWTKGS